MADREDFRIPRDEETDTDTPLIKQLSRYELERIMAEGVQLHFDSDAGIESWVSLQLSYRLVITSDEAEEDSELAKLAEGLAKLIIGFDKVVKKTY